MDKPIWEGIYQDIREVKAVGNGFNSDTWVNQSKAKVEKYLATINERNLIPPVPLRPTSLPLVAATVRIKQEGNQRIIDVGGAGFFIPKFYSKL